jgi:ATP-dependent exoDNAse (exonuclease V) beta subunit
MIVFNEEKHTYTNDKTDEQYISVTTLLGKYKTPFDKDKHSLRVAEREGVTQEMVLEMWQKENKRATDRGTKIHKLMENYVSFGEKSNDYDWLYKSYDKVISYSIERFKKIYSENLLHNDEYKIAGTADLIYDHGDYFTIGDFKTNKKFNYTSDFNEHFKAPIDHLLYCEFNNYALQMSLYAYMYELNSGKKCKKIVVFYLREDKWQPIYCNYLKSDIKNILSHYHQNKLGVFS